MEKPVVVGDFRGWAGGVNSGLTRHTATLLLCFLEILLRDFLAGI